MLARDEVTSRISLVLAASSTTLHRRTILSVFLPARIGEHDLKLRSRDELELIRRRDTDQIHREQRMLKLSLVKACLRVQDSKDGEQAIAGGVIWMGLMRRARC